MRQVGISTRDQYALAIVAVSAIHRLTISVSGHFIYIPDNKKYHSKNKIVQIHSCDIQSYPFLGKVHR